LIRRLAVLAVALAAALLIAAPAGAGTSGVIEGQVTNGTQDGSSVAGVQLTLHTLSGGAEVALATVQAEDEGTFRFAGVTTGDYTYRISLTFQQADYTFDIPAFGDNETAKTVPVTVYDSTESDSAISVVSSHTVLVPGAGAVSVQEYFLVANMADRTYIGAPATGGQRQTVRFPLPANATGLDLAGELGGGSVVNVTGGFADTRPVPPGSKEFIYSYEVKEAPARFTYNRPVYYPTIQYNLLVPGADASVTSPQLADEGTLDLGGQTFRILTGSDLQAGTAVTAKLSGPASSGGIPLLVWVGIAVVAVLLAAAVALRVIRRRSAPAVVEKDTAAQEDALLGELANLDDEFEAGRLDQETYLRQRGARKAELAALLKRDKE